LALTANAIRGVEEMFKEAGMDGMLVKPIDTVKLHAALEKWLPKEKLKRVSAEEFVAERARSEPDGKDDLPKIAGVDSNKGVKLSGGEITFYKKVLGTFADNAKEYGKVIRECLESGDLKLYTTSVHALKSASANIGAEKVSILAEDLESAGKRSDLDKIQSDTAEFLSELEAVGAEISKYLAIPGDGVEVSSEDTHFLETQLEILANAADSWDIDAVHTAINALNTKQWSEETSAVLKKISEQALVGDFDDAATSARNALLKQEE
jgi:HPt (histidine-containing phosphotransfer) domain-containing protein